MGSSSWAFLAFVISFSAIGRRAFALASVVTIASAANSEAARLAIISRWWWASAPNERPRRGVAGIVVSPCLSRSAAQRQAALVELLLHFVEALLSEVGDVEQIVFGLGQQFAHGVDLGAIQAVARALRQVEVLDGELEVRRGVGRAGQFTELEA